MSINTPPLAEFIANHQPLTVITGAGCSAASGIPTYRDHQGNWLRSDPIQHSEFLNQPAKRQRYWARSFSGWPHVGIAEPNPAHQILTQLEQAGYLKLLVTQNVDRLHQRSGHQNVIDLHGRLDKVRCLDCYLELSRDEVQQQLKELNPHLQQTAVDVRPDGDADVPDEQVARMQVPDCPRCGGMLKPDVVFYGGGVDKKIVETIYQALNESNGLLVLGSSLMVFSSFRFCRHAAKQQIPLAIVNAGTTRADDLAQLKIHESCETALASAWAHLANPCV